MPNFMPLETWRTQMREFQLDCVASTAQEQAERIREAADLFPRAFALPTGKSGTCGALAAIESMLACRAYESAALTLVEDDATFMLSRGGDGCCLASMVSYGGDEEVIAQGATPALAVLAVRAAALLAGVGERCLPEYLTRQPPASRLN
ncbi:MAG: hypothetical protein KUG65_02545 [Sphingomonadaceae bacterium]|nr:hypothetical protein [Sphingomonadaceae bacterium]